MAITGSSSSLQFATIFGQNGSIDSSSVGKFLSSLRMDQLLAGQLRNQGSCPAHNFSSEEWYNGGRSQTELMNAIWETVGTPACHTRSGGLMASLIDVSGKQVETEHVGSSSSIQVWGYGLLCVTAINLCALLGIVFMPMMGRSFYRMLLTFMTALAVGSLIATALLILLPDSLQLTVIHEELNSPHSLVSRFASTKIEREGWSQFLTARPWYIWRCCCAFGGIYLFFVLERLLKELLGLRSSSHSHSGHSHAGNSEQQQLNQHSTSIQMLAFTAPQTDSQQQDKSTIDVKIPDAENINGTPDGRGKVAGRLRARLAGVQTVAWMVLLGDSLHNFIDGISLGAAFARSPLTGLSIGLAVLCEELPHELGDFAILLSAGMSLPMAAVANLVSACVCYIGFVIGVVLGEVDGFSVWIFSAGSGMFLYISLVDMMPEVNTAIDSAKSNGLSKWRIFLLQNAGLLLGYGVILVIVIYGGEINIE